MIKTAPGGARSGDHTQFDIETKPHGRCHCCNVGQCHCLDRRDKLRRVVSPSALPDPFDSLPGNRRGSVSNSSLVDVRLRSAHEGVRFNEATRSPVRPSGSIVQQCGAGYLTCRFHVGRGYGLSAHMASPRQRTWPRRVSAQRSPGDDSVTLTLHRPSVAATPKMVADPNF
jgi:hypothetical protein